MSEIPQQHCLRAQHQIIAVLNRPAKIGVGQLFGPVNVDKHDAGTGQYGLRTQKLGDDFESQIETRRECCRTENPRIFGHQHFASQFNARITIKEGSREEP